MNYGEVLGKAGKTIWKHKILWLFGFFASCARSGGGSGGSGGSSRGTSSIRPDGPDMNMWRHEPGVTGDVYRFFNDLGNSMQYMDTGTWIVIAIVFFLLMVVLMLLVQAVATVGRNGLVYGTWKSEEGAERLTFSDIFQGSLAHFWKVFLLYLVVGLMIFALTLLFILPGVLIFLMVSSLIPGTGPVILILLGLFFLILMLLFMLLSWFISILMDLMVVAIVGENMSVMQALKRAWHIFRSKPLHILLLALILGVGNFFATFFIGIPMLIALLPMIGGITGGILSMGALSELMILGSALSLVCCCLYLPVSAFLTGVLEAYIKSAWTLAYRDLTAVQA